MFVHFIKSEDFESLERMLARTPHHLTNAETVIQELKPYMDSEKFGNDTHMLESLFQLY